MGQKTPNGLTYMHRSVGFTACKNRLVVSWKGNVFKPSNLLVGLLFCHLVNQQKYAKACNPAHYFLSSGWGRLLMQMRFLVRDYSDFYF